MNLLAKVISLPMAPNLPWAFCHRSRTSQKSPEGTALLNAICVSHTQILCCLVYRGGNRLRELSGRRSYNKESKFQLRFTFSSKARSHDTALNKSTGCPPPMRAPSSKKFKILFHKNLNWCFPSGNCLAKDTFCAGPSGSRVT